MHELITDQLFDLARSNEYILSIQVSLDGFSFSVVRINDNQLLALKHSPAKISTEKFIARRFSEWINSEEILNQQFAEVRVQYYTGNFTVVPAPYFLVEKQNEIAGLLFEQEVVSQVASTIEDKSGIEFLFTLPVNLSNAITEKFGDSKLQHPASDLAKKCMSLFAEIEKGAMLYFAQNSFLLLLYSGKDMLLTNCFNYSHANDVLYYLMAVLNQYNLKPGDTKIYLAGEISQNQTEVLLREYFGRTEFWVPTIPLNTEIFKNDLHRFITLL